MIQSAGLKKFSKNPADSLALIPPSRYIENQKGQRAIPPSPFLGREIPMQKAAATFDATKGRILPDLSKGKKKMTTTETNGAKPVKKKGQTVQVKFLNAAGEASSSPAGRDITSLNVKFPKVGTEHTFDLAKLDANILMQVAAFGLATLLRNEANTTPEDDGPEEAEANLLARWNGFEAGQYRSISSGSATPLILLALKRAMESAQKDGAPAYTPEHITKTVAKYQAMWDEGDDEEAVKKNRREITSGLMGRAPVKLARAQIEAERAAARQAKLEAAASEDLADL